jgi:predicted DNA-binding ribbon-helix-helix protein
MAPRRKIARATGEEPVGRRIRLDRRVWTALEMLARDRDNTPAELVEEALGDVLRKHGRSADLREALELSARAPRKSDRSGRARRSRRA